LAARQLRAEGVDLSTEEGREQQAALTEALGVECKAQGDKVREVGGLYVLGSERHESRRIDNQLRGRSGRQGEPGESRFFLSLDDDLLRLFASGAMSWVMDRALPDDQPIEAKMVTKAIERAQNTVEGRNAEMRKDVLKYDEVMNEQRKVIYARRLQIIDGEDLKESTIELIEETLGRVVIQSCPSDYPEEWELDILIAELQQYYPTKFTAQDLAQAATQNQVIESVVNEALEYYEAREENLLGGADTARLVEREVMLQIIDQRWRDHLSEMDYLREGINLRALAQQDPLVAWQREGFTMFGQLVDSVDDDYLRYVMHVEAVPQEAAAPSLDRAVYVAADDPVSDTSMLAGLLPDVGQVTDGMDAPRAGMPADMGEVLQPIVKADHEKIGRNDPCHCGSGKKFKYCHGAAGR
jgi:preprotein translocase subunit SecA